MDEGRARDLEKIEKRLHTNQTQKTRELRTVGVHPVTGKPMQVAVTTEHYNAKADRWGKERAAEAKAEILRQTKDKKLGQLRQRLIRAARAHDKPAEMRIAAQIKHYEGKPFEDYS